jgi:hypothetical protein
MCRCWTRSNQCDFQDEVYVTPGSRLMSDERLDRHAEQARSLLQTAESAIPR